MFTEIFNEVKEYLESHGGNNHDGGITFRKRSDHMWRVYIWVERLIKDCTENINKDALRIAALFHDIGRYISHSDHANQSALLFHDYAVKKNYDKTQAEFIEYLIRNHSDKEILFSPDIPLELVFLIEADMLDEMGALAIVWFTMSAGIPQPAENYMEAYNFIAKWLKAHEIKDTNPMRTAKAKEIWESKQNLVKEFLRQLEYDLGISE